MTVRLAALAIDAQDPDGLARFWSELLGWTRDGAVLIPADDTGFDVRFVATDQPKTTKNQAHFDLTSAAAGDQERTVARALALGARHVDVGQRPGEPHVVLADPEGNEFCIIEAGNGFLAECGFVGALACDGSSAVGHFWSQALGWPLVWDQDGETAIRAPHGGPKLTWGGYPYESRTGRNRLRLVLTGDADRLVTLGARRTDRDDELVDPDGNEFSVASVS